MLPCVGASSLTVKSQQTHIKFVEKPASMLAKVHNNKRAQIQKRLRKSIANLTNFSDLNAICQAIAEIDKVGNKNAGIDREHLLAIKRAVNRRIMNAYQRKMSEVRSCSPRNRARKSIELGNLVEALPRPFTPVKESREVGAVTSAVDHMKGRGDAMEVLREVEEAIHLCQEGTKICRRAPSEPEPPGRRLELTWDTVHALVELWREHLQDAATCSLVCQVGRRWAEPYWHPARRMYDEKDVELLDERRDLLTRCGMEMVATETIHRHRHHELLKERVVKHATHLLAALNCRLFMSMAKDASYTLAMGVVSAIGQLVKENRAGEVARLGARVMIRDFGAQYPNDHCLQVQICGIDRALGCLKIKDESITNFQTTWAEDDLNAARKLFDSLDVDESGVASVSGLGELFKKMGMKMSENELKKHIALIDVDGSGSIEWPEFLYMVESWGGVRNWSIESQFEKARLEELRKLFLLFDADGSGDISTSDLQIILASCGIHATERQVKEMIADVDADDSGTMDWYEFLFLMSKNSEQDSEAELHRRAFRLFESHYDKGKVNCAEFRDVIYKLTQGSIKPSNIDDILHYVHTMAGTDDYESLNYREFVLLMTI